VSHLYDTVVTVLWETYTRFHGTHQIFKEKKMRDYKKSVAWQRADEVTLSIYAATRNFPKEESFGLTWQIRKASDSVASNIAEGAARESKRESLHFLYIASGSLTETEYFLHLSHRLAYLSQDEYVSLSEWCNRTFAALHG